MMLRFCRWQGGARSFLLTLLVLGLLMVPGISAKADQALTNRITLDVVDAELVRVVDMLRSSSQANIIISKPDEIKVKVSATLKDVSLEQALRAIVEGTGLTWWKDNDGIYFINSEAPKPVVQETAPVVTAQLPPAPKKVIKTEKIKLRYVNPSVVVQQLGAPYMKDPSVHIPKPGAEPTLPVSSDNPVGRANAQIGTYDVTHVYDPGYTPPPPMIPSMGNMETMNMSPSVSNRTVDTRNPAVSEQRYSGPGTAPNLAPTSPGNQGTSNQSGQGRLLPDDIYLVMPYEIDNSIVVRGTDVAIDELKQVIRMLDIAPKQVLIKAEFVELTVNDESALGLDWTIQTLDSSVTATGMAPGGNIAFRFAQGNISAVLSALKTSGQAKVKNSPVITTMNNVPSSINVGTAFIYFVTTIQTPVQGNTLTTANPQVMPINTGLWVLPRVNGDGSITVTIQPQVEDTAGFAENPISKDRIPIRAYRSLTTTRRVGDGETIVIGGLNTAHNTRNEKGIPFLKDLPIIGNLFRSNQVSTNESELLIFLTPSVLPEPVSTGGVAAEY